MSVISTQTGSIMATIPIRRVILPQGAAGRRGQPRTGAVFAESKAQLVLTINGVFVTFLTTGILTSRTSRAISASFPKCVRRQLAQRSTELYGLPDS
jgi:hypothetical protein